MRVFTIPPDFDETVHRLILPICISDTDDRGNRVHYEWIEHGVAPIADKLVRLASRVLGDKWRASEIVEPVVHKLSRDLGLNLGINPSTRVLKRAKWHAEDLRVGGRRGRRKTEVELFVSTLESLEDQFDFARTIVARDTLERLVGQLSELRMDDVRAMVPMMIKECEADEYQRRFNRSRNTVTHQFYRGMRRAARAAGIIK